MIRISPLQVFATVVVLAQFVVAPHPSDAGYSFNIRGVLTPSPPGSNGGAITGFFTTDDALTTLSSYDILASGIGEFTPLNSRLLYQNLTSGFVVQALTAPAQLALFFAPPLTASGGTFTSAAGSEGSNQTARYRADGAVTVASVPEPASIVLASSFLALACGWKQFGRRRQ